MSAPSVINGYDSLKSDYKDDGSTITLSQASGLAPLSAPLALLPAYVSRESHELTMKKTFSWTASSFDIKKGGEIVLRCQATGKLGYEKVFTTPDGDVVLTMTTPFTSMSRKTTVSLPNGTPVLEIVRTNMSLKHAFRSPKLAATFIDATTGQPATVDVDTELCGNRANVLYADQRIANIRTLRAFKAERVMAVAANVDWLLMVAIYICFDMHIMELTGTHGGCSSEKKA